MRSGNQADPSRRSSRARSGWSNAIPPVCRRLGRPAAAGECRALRARPRPAWPKRCRSALYAETLPATSEPVISARARHFAADGWSVVQLVERRDGREQFAQSRWSTWTGRQAARRRVRAPGPRGRCRGRSSPPTGLPGDAGPLHADLGTQHERADGRDRQHLEGRGGQAAEPAIARQLWRATSPTPRRRSTMPATACSNFTASTRAMTATAPPSASSAATTSSGSSWCGSASRAGG